MIDRPGLFRGLLSLGLLAIPAMSWAQQTGTVHVHVENQQGKPVEGAEVRFETQPASKDCSLFPNSLTGTATSTSRECRLAARR